MDPVTNKELLDGLYRKNIAHGVTMSGQAGEYNFNWLDAASPSWLAENAGKIILTLASKMLIRQTALQEMEFTRFGYVDDSSVSRAIIPDHFIGESERHLAFYLRTKERLEKLARLDSINRRSQLAVLQFPTTAPDHQPEPGWTEANSIPVKADRDLSQVYELLRRSNIAEHSRIINERGGDGHDFLDYATHEELAASTDIIVSSGAARMAIRASLRLEMAWHQEPTVNNEGCHHKADLLYDIRVERDRAVDSFLKIRESQARMEHNQGIVARSAGTTLQKPRRPHARLKKVKSA